MISGRGEPIRLACVAGNVPFTNKCVSFDDFVKMKSTLPNGQLPVLEIESESGTKSVIGQSDAILRYVGKIGGLYPTDPIAAFEVDSITDTVEDFTGPLGMALYMSRSLLLENDFTAEEKVAFRTRFTEKAIPKYLSLFEEKLIANGSGWLVGDSITIADCKFYQAISWLTSGILDGIPTNCADAYPHVVAHSKKFKSVPEIARWYEKKGDGHYVTSEYSP